MLEANVVAVGGNVHAAAFQGAALNVARTLELSPKFIDHFMKQHEELTNAHPIIPPGIEQKFAVATVSPAEHLTPSTGGQEIGRSGPSLA